MNTKRPAAPFPRRIRFYTTEVRLRSCATPLFDESLALSEVPEVRARLSLLCLAALLPFAFSAEFLPPPSLCPPPPTFRLSLSPAPPPVACFFCFVMFVFFAQALQLRA